MNRALKDMKLGQNKTKGNNFTCIDHKKVRKT